ncbi:MAG: hypothetical protein QF797_14255 [Alphaproteobacteria bacterium]|jgi:hypothetical protein|nr:hypothetical protein [Alphaproteobacteria bacterium]|tara:strand:- start:127 stop:615 length:489 start_codon:yes stop_codon:yes gene_type:complete
MNKRPHAKPRGLAAFLPSRADGLRLSVRPKIAYAISNDAIAIAERLKDLLAIRRQPVAEVGLCVEVVNRGEQAVTITEVGFTGRFESPQVALHEPLLHDNKPWPRRLGPGESVIAHAGSSLKGHPVLPNLKRAYAKTDNDETSYGSSSALRHYVKSVGRNPG